MLDDSALSQLRQVLVNLHEPIELVATTADTDKSRDMVRLLEQIAACHDMVSVRIDGTGERAPAFEIRRTGTDVFVTFAAIPLGHEFTSLVLALLHVGGHPPKLDEQTLQTIRELPGEHHFTTYMSLSCQNCPDVVQALNIMAVLHPGITHTAVDGGIFTDEVTEKNILAVPTVYKDGEVFGQGRMSAEEIVAQLDTGSDEKAAARLNELDPFEVLIVGGGPAGASAAIYTARKGIRTGILAERFGGQVADTMGIENFPSVSYTEGPKMVSAMESHVLDYNVDILRGHEASELVDDESGMLRVRTRSGGELRAKSVILATGARWRTLGVPGEDEYRNKGVTFCPHCDGPLFKGKKVAVIGGGNSGVEAAIDLAGIVGHVTLIEFGEQMRADEVLQRKLRSLENVDIMCNAQTTEVLGNGKGVTGLAVRDRENDLEQRLDVAGVFVQIGLLPNTEWLQGAVKLSDRGEVEIDARGATSTPGVFAAGDCTTVPYKQIVISAGQGATAALSAFDHLIRN